jgi:hypothetical protein
LFDLLPFGDSPPLSRFNFGNVFNQIAVPTAGRAVESAWREAQDGKIAPHDREIAAQDGEIMPQDGETPAHEVPRETQDWEFMVPADQRLAEAAAFAAAAAGRMVQAGGAEVEVRMRAKADGRVARRTHGQLATCVWFSKPCAGHGRDCSRQACWRAIHLL